MPADLVLPRTKLAPHAVRWWAESDPDVVALQHVDGEALTYRQLDQEGRTWAAGLGRAGITAGTHVATFLPNQLDSFRVMLGLAWQRAVEIPVNPAYMGRLLEYSLELTDAEAVITTADLIPALVAVCPGLSALKTVIVVDGREPSPIDGLAVTGRDGLLDGVGAADDLPGPDGWDMAALLFTSGTTGPSKAVRMPWGAIYQNWGWVPDETLAPGQGLHCALPLFHNSGRSGFNWAMSRGGRFVTRDKFSATSVWDEVRRTECTAIALVGPLTALLHSAPPRPDDADNPLRHAVLGPMIPDMEAFEKRFGVTVCTAYGQTEIGCPLTTDFDHGPAGNCGRVSQEFPWPEVRIVDEHDVPLGPGRPGEMIVRTRAPWGLNLGYYKMEAETAVAWRNGWFHTGDVLSYDEAGNYYFVDRLKDAIRRRGENISSFEVESYVREHPDVVECAAVGVPTPLGDEEVMVAVMVKDPSSFSPSDLAAFLESRMPRFMLPRYVETVDDLPRSETTGRVRKQALRDRGVTAATWDRRA